MRNFQKVVALIALSGMCLAAPAPSDGGTASKKSTKHHAAKPVKRDETAEQLKQLKEQLDAQAAATQQLQQQLQQTQQQLQQTQQQLTQTQQTAQQADAKIATVETNSNMQVQKVQSDLSDVKTALNTTTVTVQKDEKRIGYLESPLSIAYKGIKITPGGFVAAEAVWRQHAENADVASVFNAIPFVNAPTAGTNGHLSEFRASARDSRVWTAIEGNTGSVKLAGYVEGDFFGTGPTSNDNQSTSFNLRLRQAWGQAKVSGWTVTGGQMWSLVTLNRKAADPRAEWIPNVLEAQYMVGYDWGRFASLRVAKLFDKTTVAVSLENPSQALVLNQGTAIGFAAPGNSTLASGANFSFNLAPDVHAKIAYDDAKLGHYEVKAIGRVFRDRVQPAAGQPSSTANNNLAYGGGLGAGAIIPVVPSKVDFIAQGLYGKGISRYQDSGNTDLVVRSTDNHIAPITGWSALAGVEARVTPKLEFDLYVGDEYYKKLNYVGLDNQLNGYGVESGPHANDVRGCFFEVAPTGQACAPVNKNLTHGLVAVWYNLYKGPYGNLRYGVNYAYVHRAVWAGNGGTPKANESIAHVGIKYFLP
jgi:hypothetical protein